LILTLGLDMDRGWSAWLLLLLLLLLLLVLLLDELEELGLSLLRGCERLDCMAALGDWEAAERRLSVNEMCLRSGEERVSES